MVRIVPSHEFADETGTFFRSLFIRSDIKGVLFKHAISPGIVRNCLVARLHCTSLNHYVQERPRMMPLALTQEHGACPPYVPVRPSQVAKCSGMPKSWIATWR